MEENAHVPGVRGNKHSRDEEVADSGTGMTQPQTVRSPRSSKAAESEVSRQHLCLMIAIIPIIYIGKVSDNAFDQSGDATRILCRTLVLFWLCNH